MRVKDRREKYDADKRTNDALVQIETVASSLEEMVLRLRKQVQEVREARSRQGGGQSGRT